MFTIKKKAKTPNTIWDNKTNKPLCKFNKNGVFETNDVALADMLKTMGHEVTGKADKVGNK
ncbi:MAG: hypothetical protein IKJ01_01970 [Lachnospiraceae bacterium]|nr:hypothetical protein [Lachnospiraceae bacterium]